jgi:hypothetical protein
MNEKFRDFHSLSRKFRVNVLKQALAIFSVSFPVHSNPLPHMYTHTVHSQIRKHACAHSFSDTTEQYFENRISQAPVTLPVLSRKVCE